MTRDPAWLCHRCQGSGEIRHPRWGSYGCPEPTEACPACDGTGGYAIGDRADFCCDECGDTAHPAEPTGEERNGLPIHRCRDCSDALRRIDAETEAMSA